jgi:hypothetical protein
VASVSGSETTDSTGRAALQISIQMAPGSSSSVIGYAASTTVFELNKGLLEAGEDRFAIVRWTE